MISEGHQMKSWLFCLFFTISLIDCNFGISALIKWKKFPRKSSKNKQGKCIICLKFLGLGIFLYITDGLQLNVLSVHKKTQRSATSVVTLRGQHYFSSDHTTSLTIGKKLIIDSLIMISCHEHCSSATSVTLNCFSDLVILSWPLLFVQLLSPSLHFLFSLSFLISVSPGQGETITCNAVFCICTSWERQGELGRQGGFHSSGLCQLLQPQSQPWPWATAGCCHFTLYTFLWIRLWPLWGFQHTVYMIFFAPLTLPTISYVLPFHEFMLIEHNPPPSKCR